MSYAFCHTALYSDSQIIPDSSANYFFFFFFPFLSSPFFLFFFNSFLFFSIFFITSPCPMRTLWPRQTFFITSP
eukprot:c21522_g1_i1 orf=3-221(-)